MNKREYNKNWWKNNPDKTKAYNDKWNPINNPKRIRLQFKGKTLLLKENPRKGICSKCGKKTRTHIHHFAEYHENNPLKDTIELCSSCHAYESWRLGQIRPN